MVRLVVFKDQERALVMYTPMTLVLLTFSTGTADQEGVGSGQTELLRFTVSVFSLICFYLNLNDRM